MGATASKTTTPVIEYAPKIHAHNDLYPLKTEVYTKPMADEKYATFQPKGDYALKSDLLNLKGPKGDPGTNGIDGKNGANGASGTNGKDGAQGPPGEVTKQFLKENSMWCADGDVCVIPKNIQSFIVKGGGTFSDFANLNGIVNVGGLATFNANARFNKNISIHPEGTFSIDEPNVPGGRVNIDKDGARFGGNLSVANQLNAKRITVGSWTIEETAKGLQFNKLGTGSYVIKPMDGDRWVDWNITGI